MYCVVDPNVYDPIAPLRLTVYHVPVSELILSFPAPAKPAGTYCKPPVTAPVDVTSITEELPFLDCPMKL